MQESLDGYRPQYHECGLVMHRHHCYTRSIAIRYGVLDVQIPVLSRGKCRRREEMGTVWSLHNLLALLQIRGLMNQTS